MLTGASVGNREDLTDAIFDITPTESPFTSNLSRVDASATLHEWQTDSLPAATVQPYLEGDDATADARTATVRLANNTQIFRRVISVSGTQRAIKTAGRADEYEYQLAKEGRVIKRNIEKTLLGTQASSAGATASARSLGGVATWLATNKVQFGTTHTTPGGGAAITFGTTSTIGTFTQLQGALDTVIQQVWTAGGDPGIVMLNAATKSGALGFSNFTGIATLYRDVPADQQARIVAGADWYTSNFGNHAVIPNRFMPNINVAATAQINQMYVLDMDYWAIAELRPMSTEQLAKTGDSSRAMLICELTLEARNEQASGKVGDWVTA